MKRAFTLLEMLVVVAVVVILAIIAIPAFSAMIQSSQRAQAEEALKRAMAMGHGLALRSSRGRDVAMVFMFEPPGPLTIVACAKVAEFDDADPRDTQGVQTVRREIFVPMGDADAVAMPPFWSIRGYALPTMIDNEWYEPAEGTAGAPRYTPGQPAWVFPETGFYSTRMDSPGERDGRNRQTFMVRFDGGTGRMSMTNLRSALVVSPRPSSVNRATGPGLPPTPDTAQDLEKWVQRILAGNDFNADGVVDQSDRIAKRRLIGDGCGDTILVRPVGQLALYNERSMASTLGTQIDRKTGCLYAWNPTAEASTEPDPHRPAFPAFVRAPKVTDQNINLWIEGDTNLNGAYGDLGDQAEARVFYIDRFSGEARPLALQPSSVGIDQ